jgi:hypothetical protein
MGPRVQAEEGTHPLPGTVLTTQTIRPDGLRDCQVELGAWVVLVPKSHL